MRNKIEQYLVDEFISTIKRQAKNMEGVNVSVVQLETGATNLGVPDLLLFLSTKDKQETFWLECKRLDSKAEIMQGNDKSVIMHGTVRLRPGQMRMLHKLRTHNEKACILVLSSSLDVVLLDPLAYPIETEKITLTNTKGVTLTYILPYLLQQLL